MKDMLYEPLVCLGLGFVFSIAIVFYYCNGLGNAMLIVEGTILIALVIWVMEKLMMLLFLKTNLPVFLRVTVNFSADLLLFFFCFKITSFLAFSRMVDYKIFIVLLAPSLLIGDVMVEQHFNRKMAHFNDTFKAKRFSHQSKDGNI
ncbi:MAG: hypothetical protein LKE40_00805 [Spirochaetia bacterium]|jgi:hypothetical protein|nr:hypothetical protein [Spirochaetia bacterium]